MAEIVDLELRINNLYRNGTVIMFSDGEMLLLRDKLKTVGTVKDKYYTLKYGDTLDGLAFKNYSVFVEDASKFYWLLADANNIHNPLDISELVGQEILIPDILNALLLLQTDESTLL